MLQKILKWNLKWYWSDGLLFFDKDFGDVTFCCDEMDILRVNVNNINLDNNFGEHNPDNIICCRLLVWHIKSEKRKAFKKR